MKKRTFLAFVVFMSLMVNAQKEYDNKVFKFVFEYTGDNLVNLSGGIKTGYAYVGLAHFQLDVDTEKAGWWKNGQLLINLSSSHGPLASEKLFGDLTVVSGIEAGDHIFLQDFWLRQRIRNFEFTVGIQELNDETAHVAMGELFVHSSFGISPILSANMDGPIYPHTSPGITTKWFVDDKITWLNAFYAGKAADRDRYIYNLNWSFKAGGGHLLITEIQHSVEVNRLPGTYKIGFFSNNHLVEKALTTVFPDSLDKTTWGAYASYEQTLWQENKRGIDAFAHAGISPADYSINKLYMGGAVILNGFLSRRNDDELGLGAAYAQLRKGMGHETFIEITWKKPLTNNFCIQPDFHYIITPSGRISGLQNSLAGNVRFGLVL